MPNQWERQPHIPQLLIGIGIIIIGFLLFPNFFKDISSRITSTSAQTLNDVNLSSTNSPNTLNSSISSSSLFPNVNNTLNSASGNNTLASGYWVLFVSNGNPQQLSISNQDYAFIQGLIQSDSKGSPSVKIFLIDNGQIHQQMVSNEIYSILSNMAAIIAGVSASSSTNSTSSATISPSSAASETLTISSPSTSGFTIALNPALNGLTVNNFTLVNSSGKPVSLTSAATLDNGATYAIRAALSTGQTYTLTATCPGYSFGKAQTITITSAATSETLTVSNPSTSGFTVTLNPALNDLTVSNFTLVNSSGNTVTITGATTSDNGSTYAIYAALSAGQTYTLSASYTGYTFGTTPNVVIPQ